MKTMIAFTISFTFLLFLGTACKKSTNPEPGQGPSGYSWEIQISGVTTPINAVTAVDNNHVWAVGLGGTILFYNGTSWTQDPQSGVVTDQNLWSVFALDNNHIWAVGYDAVVIFYDGATWSQAYAEPGSDHDLFKVFALNPDFVLAVSMSGHILSKTDSVTWDWIDIGYGANLFSLYIHDSNHIWVAGEDIFFFDGAVWSIADTTASTMGGINGTSLSQIWCVGADGLIRYFNGTIWVTQNSGTDNILRDVLPLNSNTAFAVGDDDTNTKGTLLYYTGTHWVPDILGTTGNLFGIATYDKSRVWVVGDHGTILMGKK